MGAEYVKLSGVLRNFTGELVAQSGRLWLVRLVDDSTGSWIVLVKRFNPLRDRACGSRSGIWRFVRRSDALTKLKELQIFYPSRVSQRSRV